MLSTVAGVHLLSGARHDEVALGCDKAGTDVCLGVRVLGHHGDCPPKRYSQRRVARPSRGRSLYYGASTSSSSEEKKGDTSYVCSTRYLCKTTYLTVKHVTLIESEVIQTAKVAT